MIHVLVTAYLRCLALLVSVGCANDNPHSASSHLARRDAKFVARRRALQNGSSPSDEAIMQIVPHEGDTIPWAAPAAAAPKVGSVASNVFARRGAKDEGTGDQAEPRAKAAYRSRGTRQVYPEDGHAVATAVSPHGDAIEDEAAARHRHSIVEVKSGLRDLQQAGFTDPSRVRRDFQGGTSQKTEDDSSMHSTENDTSPEDELRKRSNEFRWRLRDLQRTALKIDDNDEPSTSSNKSMEAKHNISKDHEQPFFMTLAFLYPVLGTLVVFEVVAAICFETLHSRWVAVDISTSTPVQYESSRRSISQMFSGFTHLMAPYFMGPDGRQGRLCTVVLFILIVLSLFISYIHNAWQKEWWDIFNKVESARFPTLLWYFIMIVIAHMLTHTYSDYVKAWLYIDWRECMTRHLMGQWLRNRTYFVLQFQTRASEGQFGEHRIDNPDQRIQEDIHLFVQSALDITISFVHSTGNMFVFAPMLIALGPAKAFGVWYVPGWLLYVSVAYALLGSLCLHVIGRAMVGNNFERQKNEADFRQLAMHIRDNSESVALYNSEAVEERNLLFQFEKIKRVQWQSMLLAKRLSFFTSAYDFTQFLIPFFILAPSYFRREISLGDLFQLTGAIAHVSGSLSWFLGNYRPLTQWRATADRLISFEAAINSIHPKGSLPGSSTEKSVLGLWCGQADGQAVSLAIRRCLSVKLDAIRLPAGDVLWSDVEIFVQPGQHVLISGPEGSGKSILLKTCAGIWPFVDGSVVRLPGNDKNQVLFVPQRPALPKMCSLAEALAYPDARSDYNNASLRQVLKEVGLTELLLEDLSLDAEDEALTANVSTTYADDVASTSGGAEGSDEPKRSEATITSTAMAATSGRSPFVAGIMLAASWAGQVRQGRQVKFAARPADGEDACDLDRVEDWGLRLSPGQQQRLAFAHVLLKCPSVVFMDEPTSNLGKESAVYLYSLLSKRLSREAMVISISHDVDTLEPVHDAHFSICAGGGGEEFIKLKGRGDCHVKGRCGPSS